MLNYCSLTYCICIPSRNPEHYTWFSNNYVYHEKYSSIVTDKEMELVKDTNERQARQLFVAIIAVRMAGTA